jgi:Flp pilus assembly protein TadG
LAIEVDMLTASEQQKIRNAFRVAVLWAATRRDAFAISTSTLWNDSRGSVALSFGLTAIALLGAVGAAVDYSRASALRTAMQGALDSTALGLAKDAQSIDQAQPTFNALFVRPEVQNLSVSGDVTNNSGSTVINLSASGTVDTTFMSVMGISKLTLAVHASAVKTSDTSGCVLALDPTMSGAVSVGGSTNVSLNDCSVYSNSNDAASVSAGGSATLSALSIGAVGKVSLSSANITTTDGVSMGLPPLADPYSDVVFPSFSGCTATNLIVNKTTTISPGVYCNGLKVNAGATLTLNPGIYYIDQGSLSVDGGATINGQGVTLVFTSSTGNNWATATINGNATVNLTAPIGGPTAGIVIFGDRQIPTGTAFKFNGGSNQYLGGAIYVPTGAISYSGGTGTSTSCTQIIGDTVNFTGNSNVANNCSSYQTRPFGPTVVRLAS